MKQFRCSIKGDITAEACSKCFMAQNPKLMVSRVLCKQEYLIPIEEAVPESSTSSSAPETVSESVPKSVFEL